MVVRGDTLYAIAWRFGIERNDLVRWNGITNPDRILVGQRLALVPPETGAPAMRNAGPVVVAAEAGTVRAAHRCAARACRGARQPASPRHGRWLHAHRPMTAMIRSRAPLALAGARRAAPPLRCRRPRPQGHRIGAGLGQTVSAAQGGEVVYSGSGLPGYG